MAEPAKTLTSAASFRVVIPYEANVGDNDGCVASTEGALKSGSYLIFRVLADGMVEIETARGDTFFLAADNRLLIPDNKAGGFKPITAFPRYVIDNGFMPEPVPLNQEIYNCWLPEVGAGKTGLTEPQNEAVIRFFQAVRNTFPEKFVGD